MFLNIKYCPLRAKKELNLALALIWHTNTLKNAKIMRLLKRNMLIRFQQIDFLFFTNFGGLEKFHWF
jgi:hypothetical protein